MTKTKSGLVLMAVGVGMNLLGWLSAVISPLWLPPSLPFFIMALLMLVSVVLFFFGLFRLVAGLFSRKKQTKSHPVAPVDEMVWPPAPQPPKANN